MIDREHIDVPSPLGMVGRVDHIGIAAADIDVLLDFYTRLLGIKASPPQAVPGEHVIVSFLELPGSRIELIQPLSDASPVAKFVRERGGGLHHICLEVSSVEAALALLSEAGLQLIDSKPRVGTQGAQVAFVHPHSTHQVLIELIERQAVDAEMKVKADMMDCTATAPGRDGDERANLPAGI